ncbi:MAG: hypothetical protein K2J82_08595 [Muribaculaceae bacterium]|nr:hypothetical protein [Muribaculaceae bacterium]
MSLKYFLILPLILLLTACSSDPVSNPELRHAQELLQNHPDSVGEAARILNSLSPASLSEGDRNLLSLLKIKADDKMYVTHTSDSLILAVVDFERKHQDRGLYPEALYYAGRVYADLGDVPTSSKWYEQSLLSIPDDSSYNPLRLRVSYHLGYSLINQFLYSSADSVLQKGIVLATDLNDSYFLQIIYELLGNSKMNRQEYGEALTYFLKAKSYSKSHPSPDSLTIDIQIAMINARQGNIVRARDYLRNIRQSVDFVAEPLYLQAAAEVCLKSGDFPKAFQYADSLLNFKDFPNRPAAFRILLDPALKDYISPDSANSYVFQYAEELNTHYSRRDFLQSQHQQSLYNYSVHEKKRREAEILSERWEWLLWIATLIILLLIILLLIRERINNRRRILLQNTILDLTDRNSDKILAAQNIDHPDTPTQDISHTEEASCPDPANGQDNHPPCVNDNISEEEKYRIEKIEKLKKRLMPVINGEVKDKRIEIPLESSEILNRFKDNIVKNELTSVDWQYLEQEVMRYSPDFRDNLSLLSDNSINEAEYRVALLIRCHFRPKEISCLLNVKPGTISKQRGDISRKIFQKNVGTKLIDIIIQSL